MENSENQLWVSSGSWTKSFKSARNGVIICVIVFTLFNLFLNFMAFPDSIHGRRDSITGEVRVVNITFEDKFAMFLVIEGLTVGLLVLAFLIIYAAYKLVKYHGPRLIVYKTGLQIKGRFVPWSDITQIRVVSQAGARVAGALAYQTGDYAGGSMAYNAAGSRLVGIKDIRGRTKEVDIADWAGLVKVIEDLGMKDRLVFTNQFKTMFGFGMKSDYEKKAVGRLSWKDKFRRTLPMIAIFAIFTILAMLTRNILFTVLAVAILFSVLVNFGK